MRLFLLFLVLFLVGCGETPVTKGTEQNPYHGTVMTTWSDPYDGTDPIEATFYSTPTYGHQYDIDILIINNSALPLERVVEVGTRTWSVEIYIIVAPNNRIRAHLITTSSLFESPSVFRSYAMPSGAG